MQVGTQWCFLAAERRISNSAWRHRRRGRRREQRRYRRWRWVRQRKADAGGRHGHGVGVPAGARGHQERRDGGHRGTCRWSTWTCNITDPLAGQHEARAALVPPAKKEDAVLFDFEGVWRAMEECQRLGLARAIGVSNFTTKHLDKVLAVAAIPPAVNQVEVNPVWQQRTLRAYCAEKGIHVAAYSPLGGQNWNGQGNAVLESEVLAEIAKARGKTVAQVSLRWIYEQGVTSIAKSYNMERLKQNLEIFGWELTDEDRLKISQIPQKKAVKGTGIFSGEDEFTSITPADLDIVE